MRILCIDFGTKRLGFALGDSATKIALPMDTVELNGRDAVMIARKHVDAERPDEIVVGLPLDADGNRTEACAPVERFIHALQEVVNAPIRTQSEHLSTKMGDVMATDAGSALHDDAMAAMVILQEYLDSIE